MDLLLKVELFTYWHISSGSTGGKDEDTKVVRDKNNIPYIPGKTLKGIIRDSFEDCKKALDKEELIADIFGHEKEIGKATFSNAELSLEDYSIVKGATQELYRHITSNRVNEISPPASKNGKKKKNRSLRTIEVAIPLTLYSRVQSLPDEYRDDFKLALSLVSRLGYKRNRGLGECSISIEKELL